MTNDIEKYGNHEFEIFEYPDDDYPDDKSYYYRIYLGDKNYTESDGNMFESYNEARFAVIGHITLLEQGRTP